MTAPADVAAAIREMVSLLAQQKAIGERFDALHAITDDIDAIESQHEAWLAGYDAARSECEREIEALRAELAEVKAAQNEACAFDVDAELAKLGEPFGYAVVERNGFRRAVCFVAPTAADNHATACDYARKHDADGLVASVIPLYAHAPDPVAALVAQGWMKRVAFSDLLRWIGTRTILIAPTPDGAA